MTSEAQSCNVEQRPLPGFKPTSEIVEIGSNAFDRRGIAARTTWVTRAHITLTQIKSHHTRALASLLIELFASQMQSKSSVAEPCCRFGQNTRVHLVRIAKRLWEALKDCVCIPTAIPDGLKKKSYNFLNACILFIFIFVQKN